jgi:hypothetical protein
VKLRAPIWAFFLLLAVSCPDDLVASQSTPGIILDTDFRSDVDDVGTLALVNALADNGECALLGVMASQTGPWVVGAINAVNTWYGRGHVPIGRSPVDDQRFEDFYAPVIGDPERYPSTQSTATAPDSTLLYRRLLEAAADQSVIVVVVGGQTCVHRLLLSPADPEGDGSIGRSGRELIAAKVRQLVIMGGNFIDPNQREHNIALDMEAAQTVAESWPTPIAYSGFEIGRPVMTGGALTQPDKNPVAKAYELFPAGGIGTIASSSSYDQTALYYAVRGTESEGGRLWQLSEPGWASFPDARTRFARSAEGRHRHLVRHASDETVGAVIEALMIQPPRRQDAHTAAMSTKQPAASGESVSANDGTRPGDDTPQVLGASPAASDKPRLLVLTDIGGDPDDQQSMIRLMLYANEFESEGFIASASGTPGELKEKVVQPQLIRQIVEAYGQVRSNLTRHANGYPTAEQLLARIKSGNPNRGRDAVGEGHDTEGSQWIITVADRSDSRLLNIAIWGGQTDLAQALWRVRQDRGAAGLAKFVQELRVYDIADQDGIAEWIWEEFPGLFYILNKAGEGRDRREAAFRGLYLGGDESLVSRAWMETNIRQDHGPLGALYPPRTWTAPNPHSAIKEGDTPSWFFFLPNGLGHPDHPEWGGWGGRFNNSHDRIYRDAQDTVGNVTDARTTVWRWREAFQNDFGARLDWCVAKDFKQANHNPIAVLNGDTTRRVLALNARPGETVTLSAAGSSDPDGHPFTTTWFVYREAGTFEGKPALSGATSGELTAFVAPTLQESETIHIVLQLEDHGTPSLFAHRRAVVTVRP